MTGSGSRFPRFPPGFWRRIELHPYPGLVIAGLEDDVHRFLLRIRHRNSRIAAVDVRADRYPWSSCPGAGDFLTRQLVGRSLDDVAGLNPAEQCTHMHDLAILGAVHADGEAPVRFDLQVADRVEQRTRADLLENGVRALSWDLNGTQIEGPIEWAGKDLRKLSAWKRELTPRDAIRATILRRAVFVSGVRRQPAVDPTERAADRGPERLGACYTYQLPRALDAVRVLDDRKDFSLSGTEPLQDFDPESLKFTGWSNP